MGSGVVRLRYTPIPVGVDTTVRFTSNQIGGFLAATAGTISISTVTDQGEVVAYISIPVTAGQWLHLPFYIGTNGGAITTAGGASGILGV